MMQDNSEKRLTGTVAKRNGARVFIREASQPMGTHDKVTNFLHSQSLRHAATGPPAKLSLIHMPLDPKGSVVHLGQKVRFFGFFVFFFLFFFVSFVLLSMSR